MRVIMIGYIMFGTNDLKKSIKFYDSFLNKLDLVKTDYQKEFVGYANKYDQENIIFYITKPFDGKQASFGNGTMVAFKAFSTEIVDNVYELALTLSTFNIAMAGL